MQLFFYRALKKLEVGKRFPARCPQRAVLAETGNVSSANYHKDFTCELSQYPVSWPTASVAACTTSVLCLYSLLLASARPSLAAPQTAAPASEDVHPEGYRGCFFEGLEDFKFVVTEYTHLGISHVEKEKKDKPVCSPTSKLLLGRS